MTVFINDIAVFLPNQPVCNEDIEEVLGQLYDIPSNIKLKILEKNGIKARYYAIDPKTKKLTHTNAQITAEVIRRLKPYNSFKLEDIECLVCGTSTPDTLLPGHALMVHGELKSNPCDVVTTAGICLSGITALKYAFMNIETGFSQNAVACGSEISSFYIRSNFLQHKLNENKEIDIDKMPMLAFNAEFLRWMLSDASGAVFLSNKTYQDKISLKIDWIEHISFANQLDTCMYAGAVKNDDGSITGFREASSLEEAFYRDFFPIKQDIKLLNEEIVKTAIDKALTIVIKKYNLKNSDIDWFLPHYSSEYFRDKLFKRMNDIDFKIPYEKWFTNLTTKGNTGAASIYVILEELFHSKKLCKGQKILCLIPESGRFSIGYMQLAVM